MSNPLRVVDNAADVLYTSLVRPQDGMTAPRLQTTHANAGTIVNLFAMAVVEHMTVNLMHRWFPSEILRLISNLGVIAEQWLFVNDTKYRRHSKHVECIWAVCHVYCTTAWIVGNRATKQSKHAGSVMSTLHRDLIWAPWRLREMGPGVLRQVATSFAAMQTAAFRAPDRQQSWSCVYGWLHAGFLYVGYAGHQRTHQVHNSGVTYRWLEHGMGKYKEQPAHCTRWRYTMARKFGPLLPGFVVLREGPMEAMKIVETLAIGALKPVANAQRVPHDPLQLSASVRTERTTTRRRRPLPSRRLTLPHPGPTVDDGTVTKRLVKLALPPRQVHAAAAQWASPPTTERAAKNIASSPIWSAPLPRLLDQIRETQMLPLGPINLYDQHMWPALVMWLCMPIASPDWHAIARSWGCRHPALLLTTCLRLPMGRLRQQRLRQQLNRAMKAARLPALNPTIIKVPFAELIPITRTFIKETAKRSYRDDCERAWILRQMRVVRGKAPSHKDDCCASAASKTVTHEDLERLPASDTSAAILMKGAIFINKRWDIPKRFDSAGLMNIVCEAVVGALHPHVRHCKNAIQKAARYCEFEAAPSVRHLLRRWSDTNDAYDEHTHDMHVPSGYTGVGDDKGKACGWHVPNLAFTASMYTYVTNSPFWEVTAMTWEQANKALQHILAELIPSHLHGWLSIDDTTPRLPHMYITVKSKCFDPNGGGRTCVKESHSCCRKIISYASWPKRRNWQMIARAVETTLKHYSHGAEIWRLKDAAKTYRARLTTVEAQAHEHIRGPNACTCQRCGGSKLVWEGLVADAGQFFETVTPECVEDSMTFLFSCALKAGHPGKVTTITAPTRRAYFGGYKYNPVKHSKTFTLADLHCCVMAAANMSFASVGSRVVRLRGLPIGGFMSKIACSVVLGAAEQAWAQNQAHLLREGFLRTGQTWLQAVAWARYVDDAVLASPYLCRACLQDALNAFSPVQFDATADTRRLKWLDLVVDLDTLTFDMADKDFAMPPPWSARFADLRAYMIGRAARWAEVRLSSHEVTRLCIKMIAELHAQGWRARHFRYVFYSTSARSHAREFKALRAALWHSFRP